MSLDVAYKIVAGAAAVVAMNALYVRRRGFGSNPENWVMAAIFSIAVGVFWPAIAAVLPGKIILKRARRRDEARRVAAATVEQLAEEDVRRVVR